MEDMNLKARGESLKTLMGAMDEDEIRRVPKVNIVITGGTLGDVQDDSTKNDDMTIEEGLAPVEGEEMGAPDMEEGSEFDKLIARKKRKRMGK